MLDCKLQNDVLTFSFDHSLDTNVCHRIEPVILEKLNTEKYSKVIFDLKDVNYTASAFLRICLTVAEKVGYEKFSIINTVPFIKKVFKIAGLDQKLNLH